MLFVANEENNLVKLYENNDPRSFQPFNCELIYVQCHSCKLYILVLIYSDSGAYMSIKVYISSGGI